MRPLKNTPTGEPYPHPHLHHTGVHTDESTASTELALPLEHANLSMAIDECSCIDLHGAHLYDVARGESIATAARPALSALSKGEDVDSSVRWLHPLYTFRPTAQIPREQVQGEQL